MEPGVPVGGHEAALAATGGRALGRPRWHLDSVGRHEPITVRANCATKGRVGTNINFS